jgi:hypothetical protein
MSRSRRQRSILARTTGCLALVAIHCACALGAGGEATSVSIGQNAASIGTMLIVHSGHLEPAAAAWDAWRSEQGWRVERVAVGDGRDVPPHAEAIRDLIRRSHQRHAERAADAASPFVVLLLGDADERGVPTWRFEQRDPDLRSRSDPDYVTDHPYQLIDDDASPDIALGRVPARTVDEAQAVLEKLRQYEQAAPGGAWRARITYVAGEGRFGAYDQLLEWMFRQMVDRLVPDSFEVSMTYARGDSIYCPPPSRLTESVLERMSEGGLLFNYVGHGRADAFDALYWRRQRHPILEVDDLDDLADSGGRLPIALLTCCSAGWYDLPAGRRSLAEAMLLHPHGPVAVIAGSRITHPYANALVQKEFTTVLLEQRIGTIGELDLLATRAMLTTDALDRQLDLMAGAIARFSGWHSSLLELRRMHVELYNLLGDPATRIALPPRHDVALTFRDDIIEGAIPVVSSGTAHLTIRTERASLARADLIRVVHGDDDPNLEKLAAINYPLANDRVLMRIDVPIVEGRFRVALEHPLSAAARVIRVRAIGTNEAGEKVEAFAAIRIGPDHSGR